MLIEKISERSLFSFFKFTSHELLFVCNIDAQDQFQKWGVSTYIYMTSFIHKFITSQKRYEQGYIHIEVPHATSSFYCNHRFRRFAHNTVNFLWLIPLLDAILYKLQLIFSLGPQPFIPIGVFPWTRSNAISLSAIANRIWSRPYLCSNFPMR